MLAAEQFHSWDRRENRAIDNLCPSLNQALATGNPAVVQPFETSLTNSELVGIAVALCKRSDSQVAVVGSHDSKTLAFVPLVANTSFAKKQVDGEARRVRPRAPAWSAAGVVGPTHAVTI